MAGNGFDEEEEVRPSAASEAAGGAPPSDVLSEGAIEEPEGESGNVREGSKDGQGGPRTIHDGLFKRVFEKAENAASLLRAITPEEIAEHIDWDTLEGDRASLSREEFRQLHCDLLFRARWVTGEELYLQLIAEHQSTVDHWMSLRGLSRVTGLWERHRIENKSSRHLPVVLVYVVYHGSTRWTAPTSVGELIEVPDKVREALRPYLASFSFLLDDLHEVSHEQLAVRETEPFPKLSLVMFKIGRGENALDELAQYASSIVSLHRLEDGDRLLEILVRYLWRVNRGIDAKKLGETLKSIIGPEAESLMMTFAQKLEKQGFDEGMKKGVREGQRDFLLAMIRQRFDDVPDEIEARIAQAPIETLHRWGMRVLDASSLDEVFGEPRE